MMGRLRWALNGHAMCIEVHDALLTYISATCQFRTVGMCLCDGAMNIWHAVVDLSMRLRPIPVQRLSEPQSKAAQQAQPQQNWSTTLHLVQAAPFLFEVIAYVVVKPYESGLLQLLQCCDMLHAACLHELRAFTHAGQGMEGQAPAKQQENQGCQGATGVAGRSPTVCGQGELGRSSQGTQQQQQQQQQEPGWLQSLVKFQSWEKQVQTALHGLNHGKYLWTCLRSAEGRLRNIIQVITDACAASGVQPGRQQQGGKEDHVLAEAWLRCDSTLRAVASLVDCLFNYYLHDDMQLLPQQLQQRAAQGDAVSGSSSSSKGRGMHSDNDASSCVDTSNSSDRGRSSSSVTSGTHSSSLGALRLLLQLPAAAGHTSASGYQPKGPVHNDAAAPADQSCTAPQQASSSSSYSSSSKMIAAPELQTMVDLLLALLRFEDADSLSLGGIRIRLACLLLVLLEQSSIESRQQLLQTDSVRTHLLAAFYQLLQLGELPVCVSDTAGSMVGRIVQTGPQGAACITRRGKGLDGPQPLSGIKLPYGTSTSTLVLLLLQHLLLEPVPGLVVGVEHIKQGAVLATGRGEVPIIHTLIQRHGWGVTYP